MGPEVSEEMRQNLFLDVLRFNSISHATLLHHLLTEERREREREGDGEREGEGEGGRGIEREGVQRRKRKRL